MGRSRRRRMCRKIGARLMLHYAGLDERINAGIPAFEEAMKAAGTDYQLFLYEGANHAFNNETSAARYDKARGRPGLVAHHRILQGDGGCRLTVKPT